MFTFVILCIRGVKEQYYEGAFIVQNSAVDNHLEKLGYNDEVGMNLS